MNECNSCGAIFCINMTSCPVCDSTSYKPEEPLHPLERKYGKEPKIKPEDLWKWH